LKRVTNSQIEDVAAWLASNAFRCALGRVSLETCRKMRMRPSVADWANQAVKAATPQESIRGVRFRPSVCEKCSGPVASEAEESRKDESMAKIVKCAECGEEKEHLARGMCHHCYWKFNGKRKRDSKKAQQAADGAAETAPKKEAGVAADKKPNRKHSPKECNPSGGGQKITIDFTGCGDLYERLQRAAFPEDRTVELQARHFIRQCLPE